MCPFARMPRSKTPARPRCLAFSAPQCCRSELRELRPHATNYFRGSITRPTSLAVYASRPSVARWRARLASGCWLGFAGRAHPAGLIRKVSLAELPPCPGLSWRTVVVVVLAPRACPRLRPRPRTRTRSQGRLRTGGEHARDAYRPRSPPQSKCPILLRLVLMYPWFCSPGSICTGTRSTSRPSARRASTFLGLLVSRRTELMSSSARMAVATW